MVSAWGCYGGGGADWGQCDPWECSPTHTARSSRDMWGVKLSLLIAVTTLPRAYGRALQHNAQTKGLVITLTVKQEVHPSSAEAAGPLCPPAGPLSCCHMELRSQALKSWRRGSLQFLP